MAWITVAAVLVVVLVLVVVGYNYLVVLDQRRQQALGDVAAQLNQRWDLVPQMAQLVGRYMTHESGLLQSLTEVRAQEGRVPVEGTDDSGIAATMARFFARAEDYPDLRADNTFVRMQQAVEETESQLAAARRMLNAATAQYNSAVGQFPLNIVAKMFGFGAGSFVERFEGAQNRPGTDGL